MYVIHYQTNIYGDSIHHSIAICQLSVLKALAGNPAILNRFGNAVSENANRTATGSFTLEVDTTIVFPLIFALAG